jgi:hypothetical protein
MIHASSKGIWHLMFNIAKREKYEQDSPTHDHVVTTILYSFANAKNSVTLEH